MRVSCPVASTSIGSWSYRVEPKLPAGQASVTLILSRNKDAGPLCTTNVDETSETNITREPRFK